MKYEKSLNLSRTALIAAICTLAFVALILAGCSSSSPSSTNGSTDGSLSTGNTSGATPAASSPDATQNRADKQTIEKGKKLVIAKDDILGTARFFPISIDGVDMEVLAVKDAQGTIRTAFNTCQVCYTSGNGFYKQVGDKLVCQNCGNEYAVDQVEIQSGGCNPWPIFSDSKTETDKNIEISYDFLKESEQIFSNWKVN